MPPKAIKPTRVTKASVKKITRRSYSEIEKAIANSNSISTAPTSLATLHSKVRGENMAVTATPAESAESSSEPVYFWKPHDRNGFLGQWYESEWTHNGERYVTAEMWMMVQKARLFDDEKVAKQMLETTNPKSHKALGRQVNGFDEKVWNASKCSLPAECK
jgi:hypothetical protein